MIKFVMISACWWIITAISFNVVAADCQLDEGTETELVVSETKTLSIKIPVGHPIRQNGLVSL